MLELKSKRVLFWGMVALGLGLVAANPSWADKKKPESATVKPDARKDQWWQDRHTNFLSIVKKGDVDVIFLGDSITDAWGGEGHNKQSPGNKLFEKEFLPLKTINLGIGGDQTQHVLWRMQNGELEGLHPKVVMLMIGTNNSHVNSAREIAAGIKAIVKEIQKRSPETKMLLLGVFPRGPKPDAIRDKLKQVNTIISKLDDGGKTVKYLDIGGHFVQDDGTISKEIMPDYLHLSEKGYQLWADAVKEPILELLGKK